MIIKYRSGRSEGVDYAEVETKLGRWELVESREGALCLRLIEGLGVTMSVEPLAANFIKVSPVK